MFVSYDKQKINFLAFRRKAGKVYCCMLKRVRMVKRSDTRRGRSKAAIKGQCRITRVISSQFHTVHWTVRTQVSMVFPGLFKSQLLGYQCY